jgi:hypothetical protein
MPRIGVTGHRHYLDGATIEGATDVVLDRIMSNADEAAELTIVSPLAEGADRMVAELVLRRPHARLEALLPLPADDYADDFATAGSRTEFESLLARAATVEVIDGDGTRLAAYERVGRAVVDRCDVLLALWDGRPSRGRGGVADVIQYALDREVLVEVVLDQRDPA